MASNWENYVEKHGRPASNAGSEDFDSFLLGRGLKKPSLRPRRERQQGDLIDLYQWYVDNGVSELRAAYWVVDQDKGQKLKPKFAPREWLDRVKACSVGVEKCVPKIVGAWRKNLGMDEREAFAKLDTFIDEFEDSKADEEAVRRAEAAAEAAWQRTRPEPGRRWAIIAAAVVVVIVIVIVAVVSTKDKYTTDHMRHPPPSIWLTPPLTMPLPPTSPPPMSPPRG